MIIRPLLPRPPSPMVSQNSLSEVASCERSFENGDLGGHEPGEVFSELAQLVICARSGSATLHPTHTRYSHNRPHLNRTYTGDTAPFRRIRFPPLVEQLPKREP